MNPINKISVKEIDEVILQNLALPEAESHLKYYFKMLNYLLLLVIIFTVATIGLFLIENEFILRLAFAITTVGFVIVLVWHAAWAQDELQKAVTGLVLLGMDHKRWHYIYMEKDNLVLSNKRPLGFYFKTSIIPAFPLPK